MSTPRVCILRAPGTNCDVETAHAFELAGATAERIHLFRLLENPEQLRAYQILCIPGGFSYGDDLGAGVIFSRQLRGRLNEMMNEFLEADKLLLGICNGFQVLLKSGLLMHQETDSSDGPPQFENNMTLTWNENARYTDCWVKLKVASNNCVFLRGMDEFESPIAHAEGRLVFRDESVLGQLREQDSVALCYWSEDAVAPYGDITQSPVLPAPANPNGSTANIAGLCDRTGRVFGLMPSGTVPVCDSASSMDADKSQRRRGRPAGVSERSRLF